MEQVDTVIATSSGKVRGFTADGAYVALGVPYAAPPFGANRLRPPLRPERWDGVRDATKFGPSPPQVAPPQAAGGGWDTDVAGEDCLNLNIWTPDPGTSGLPVMVWIQGGQFEIGATKAYDGSRFARDGVVCVVINWRVGADGFVYLGHGSPPGTANLGLLDQVAALEWVQENIAAFGGDPANVTVFGESAGAMSIGMLLSMPRAEGLFRRAITESGAAHPVTSARSAERIGRELAAKLGVAPVLDALAAVPVERMLAAETDLKADLLAHPDPDRWGEEVLGTMMPWQPVIDGDVIPGPPIERVAAGASADVDLITGTNADDWRLFRAITGEIGQITDEALTGPVTTYGSWALAAYGLQGQEALAEYRARYPDASPGELLADVQTDWWVRIPSIRLADAHASAAAAAGTDAGTYMYEFAWPAPGLGAVHALEVPFVFDTLDANAPLFGPLLADANP
ncbi:carboxylesterase/lipase family protein, partial [Oryzihumus sp.]|uniref:carboxylesterase/lipase family protein n=1 Tax=Oryzihumus sp. TaxID=1968903 RepID=UPI002ED9EB2B